ncbi:MAG: YraN family protein [Thermodesulfobacteriota bacterium]
MPAETTDRKSLGKKGEDIACRALKKDRYRVLEKNYRCRQGEIDIIAEDKKGVLCFVEVKAKSSVDFGLPEEAVTRRKQGRIQAAAYSYIESRELGPRPMRFDVVSVDLVSQTSRIIKDAFEADM